MIIDLHSHILPGVDDGSPDTETSLKMLRMASEQGVEVQVLTPHYYPWNESIPDFLARREAGLRALKDAAGETPRLLCGSETAFFAGMSRKDLDPLCIEGTGTLLIEMPFESWDSRTVDEIAALSLDRGYDVVLAHIERFIHYRGNLRRLQELSRLPLFLQINGEAFRSLRKRRTALWLAKMEKAPVLGSDAHNCTTRRPDTAPARRVIEKCLGRACLEEMDRAAEYLTGGLRKPESGEQTRNE